MEAGKGTGNNFGNGEGGCAMGKGKYKQSFEAVSESESPVIGDQQRSIIHSEQALEKLPRLALKDFEGNPTR